MAAPPLDGWQRNTGAQASGDKTVSQTVKILDLPTAVSTVGQHFNVVWADPRGHQVQAKHADKLPAVFRRLKRHLPRRSPRQIPPQLHRGVPLDWHRKVL